MVISQEIAIPTEGGITIFFMINRFINYIKETRQELRKVNWPTRSQTVQYTILVIAISIGVALVLGGFDFVYRSLVNKIIFHI
jgi:preprotein translocase subunit SecE